MSLRVLWKQIREYDHNLNFVIFKDTHAGIQKRRGAKVKKMVNEELDYKEADSDLCHHNKVAITEQLK